MARKIEITRHYNNVDGASIQPGVYSIDDPRVQPYITRLEEIDALVWLAEPIVNVEPELPKPDIAPKKSK